MAYPIDRSDVFNPQTPLALKDEVWSVLTVDSLNRLKVTPVRLEELFKNATAVNQYFELTLPNHSWTTQLTYTVPQDKIAIIQTIVFRTTTPSSGALLGIRMFLDDVEYMAYFNNASNYWNFGNMVMTPHTIVLPGQIIRVDTYSNDTANRMFSCYIWLLLFPTGT
jgi:hypothetical protein